MFLLMLALVSWVVYWEHPAIVTASTLVCIVAFFTMVCFGMTLLHRWGDYLQDGTIKWDGQDKKSSSVEPDGDSNRGAYGRALIEDASGVGTGAVDGDGKENYDDMYAGSIIHNSDVHLQDGDISLSSHSPRQINVHDNSDIVFDIGQQHNSMSNGIASRSNEGTKGNADTSANTPQRDRNTDRGNGEVGSNSAVIASSGGTGASSNYFTSLRLPSMSSPKR